MPSAALSLTPLVVSKLNDRPGLERNVQELERNGSKDRRSELKGASTSRLKGPTRIGGLCPLAHSGVTSLSPRSEESSARERPLPSGLGIGGISGTHVAVPPSASIIAARLEHLLGTRSTDAEAVPVWNAECPEQGNAGYHRNSAPPCGSNVVMPVMPGRSVTSREPRGSRRMSSERDNRTFSPTRALSSGLVDDLARAFSPVPKHAEDAVLEPLAPSSVRYTGSCGSRQQANKVLARRSSRLVLEGDNDQAAEAFAEALNAESAQPMSISDSMSTHTMESVASTAASPVFSPAGTAPHSRAGSKQRVTKPFIEHDTFIFLGSGTIWDVEVPPGENARKPQDLESRCMLNLYVMLSQRKRVLFVSNSTHHSRQSYLEELRQRGLDMRRDESPAALLEATDNIVSVGHTCAQFLTSRGVSKPFVFTSQTGLLEDMIATRRFEVRSTNDEVGVTRDLYSAKPNAKHMQDAMDATVDTDAVVVDWDKAPTALKLAVSAKHLSSKVQLVTCCLSDWKRKLRTLWDGTMCRSLTGHHDGIEIDVESRGSSMRWPSKDAILALAAPKASGGYGVDLEGAVFVSNNMADVDVVRQSGIACMLIASSLSSKMKLRQMRDQGRCMPDWVVPTFADVVSLPEDADLDDSPKVPKVHGT